MKERWEKLRWLLPLVIFVLGLGLSLLVRFAAEGMNSAAFRHGPLEVISPQTFVMVYLGAVATSTLNTNLVQDIRSAGGLVELVSMGEGSIPFYLPTCPYPALPILEILVAQMVSLALAKIQGFEAGQFIHISKVTATE